MDVKKITELIPKFGGGGNEKIEQWLDRLDVAVEIFGVDGKEMIVKMMPLLLLDDAYATWGQLDEKEKKDYDGIKSALRQVFGKSKLVAWQELKNLKLLPGDSLDVLLGTIKGLFKIISGKQETPEEVVGMHFLDALPNSISAHLRVLHGEKMELKEILISAKSLWATNSEQVNNSFAFVGSRFNTPKRNVNNVSQSKIRCFCCNRIGHTRENCYVSCFLCGERGHYKKDCKTQISGNGSAGVKNEGDVFTSAKKQ